MKVARTLLKVLAVLAVWLGLAGFFGRLQFTPAMTDALIRITDALNIHGLESVEDFYMVVTLVLSLVLALLIVALGSRLLARAAGAR